MAKLSIIITSHNNQDLIEDCLKSARPIAAEIIVVDNESTDNTVKIAKKYTKNILSHPNQPLILNKAKNYGFTRAKSDWIFSLDSDERLSPELAKDIQNALKQKPARDVAGYEMPRKNIIFGQWIKHGLWYPDYQTRLFRRGQGKFPCQHNHEKLSVKGKVGRLNSHLIHYNYQTVSQYVRKINLQYSDNEAEALIKSGKKIHWYDAIRMPISDFLSNFFSREGYKDGLHGLVLAIFQAFYTFVVWAKIWERQKFWSYQPEEFLTQVNQEIDKDYQETKYWFNLKLNKTSSLIKKLINKLKP